MTRAPVGCARIQLFSRVGLLVLLAPLLAVKPATAQGVQLQAGSSSLFSAHGGSIDLRFPTFTTTVGLGYLGDRLTFGFVGRKVTSKGVFSVGDDTVDFNLPADVFGGHRYMTMRGAGVELARGPNRVRAIAGTTSTARGAPYFRGANWGTPAALLFYDRSIASRLQLFSRSSFSKSLTSIHGLKWRPGASLVLGAAAGVGAGKPYLGVSAVLDRKWITATGAYYQQEPGFRRIIADSPMAAEPARENLAITVRPASRWSIGGSRQTLIDDTAGSTAPGRVTVNQMAGSMNAGGLRLIGSVYDSYGQGIDNRGMSVSIGRRLYRAIDIGADYFRSMARDRSAGSSTAAIRMQETINPRISLLQVVTRAGHRTSFNLGGEFLSNPIRLSVGYHTVYVPFRTGEPFVQTVAVDLRLNVMDTVYVQAGTYTMPNGRVRYTVSTTRVWSHDPGSTRHRMKPAKFQRYIVHGNVRDVDGQPVAGAVVRVGNDVSLTNEQGRFFVRVSDSASIDLKVVTEEFLSPGQYEVVSAPAKVTPSLEARPTETLIVVARR